VPQAAVTAYVHQSLDIRTDFPAKVTFNNATLLDDRRDLSDLRFREVTNANRRVHICLCHDLGCHSPANSVN